MEKVSLTLAFSDLQDRVARMRGEGSAQQALAGSWEEARAGQLEMALTLAEEDLEGRLEEVARETDIELRVHVEMETILENTILVRDLETFYCFKRF